MPSEQTTVVVSPGGTTMVVFLAGAGGLLLLMHPVSIGASAIKVIARSFTVIFLCPLAAQSVVKLRHPLTCHGCGPRRRAVLGDSA